MFTPVMLDGRDAIKRQTSSSSSNGTSLNFESLNKRFLGPKAICVFVSAIETGIIIVLLARFLTRRKERLAIRLLVYSVTFLALFQMGTTFAEWWRVSVLSFGNWKEVSNLQWPDKIYFGLSSLIAAPVQLFYVWRCWHLTLNSRPYIAFFLVLSVIGSVAAEIYVMVIECLVDWHSGNTKLLATSAFYKCSMLSLAFSVVTDFAVTGILLVFLTWSRSDMHTKQFRHILFRLILITWEAAVPPFTCAIAALIVGARSAPIISSWGLMLQTVLGKLYVISLFMSLEGRAMLAEAANRTHFPTIPSVNRNVAAWSVRPGESYPTDASKPPDMTLEFKVFSSDQSTEGTSTFCPETSKPHAM